MISAKKLATIGAAGALLVMSATPAFAGNFISQSNCAIVGNAVNQNANTGNQASGFGSGHNLAIGTGNAANNAFVVNKVNKNDADVCGCSGHNFVTQKNGAFVSNEVNQNANTGNQADGFLSGGNKAIHTGDASNGAAVVNVVNSNVVH